MKKHFLAFLLIGFLVIGLPVVVGQSTGSPAGICYGWNEAASTIVAGYNLYYSTTVGACPGPNCTSKFNGSTLIPPTNTCSVAGVPLPSGTTIGYWVPGSTLTSGTDYYACVTAVSTASPPVESPCSNVNSAVYTPPVVPPTPSGCASAVF